MSEESVDSHPGRRSPTSEGSGWPPPGSGKVNHTVMKSCSTLGWIAVRWISGGARREKPIGESAR